MRMTSKARFLLQMLAVSLAWATGPAMAQAQPAVALKAVPAKAQACTFVSASADGKEQICVKAGAAPAAKASVATTAATAVRKASPGTPGRPASPSLAKAAGKGAGSGLSLKSATALKSPPAAKGPELPADKISPAALAPAPTQVADPAGAAPSPAAPVAVAVAPVPRPAPAQAAAPLVAAVPVAAVPEPVKAVPAPRKLRSDEAARRFTDGLELERKGDAQAAMLAYHDAAESGHGLAQKRLGDIYGTGTAFAERDYGQALKWYEKARAQGIEIPKPFTYSGLRQ